MPTEPISLMQAWPRVLTVIDAARHLGRERQANGTTLIGHVPHVARLAYLHTLYEPLTMEELAALVDELGRGVPTEFADFLTTKSNGLHLFSNALAIEGFPRRTWRDPSIQEPFSLARTNRRELGLTRDTDPLAVGGYKSDGSMLFVEQDGTTICRAAEDERVITTWPSFATMLATEVRRLQAHFDDDGHRIDRSRPTSPVGGG